MFYERFEELRKKRGFSKRYVADYLGFSPKAIPWWRVAPDRVPNNTMMRKLEALFGVERGYFLREDEPKEEQTAGVSHAAPTPAEQINMVEAISLLQRIAKLSRANMIAIDAIIDGLLDK